MERIEFVDQGGIIRRDGQKQRCDVCVQTDDVADVVSWIRISIDCVQFGGTKRPIVDQHDVAAFCLNGVHEGV